MMSQTEQETCECGHEKEAHAPELGLCFGMLHGIPCGCGVSTPVPEWAQPHVVGWRRKGFLKAVVDSP